MTVCDEKKIKNSVQWQAGITPHNGIEENKTRKCSINHSGSPEQAKRDIQIRSAKLVTNRSRDVNMT